MKNNIRHISVNVDIGATQETVFSVVTNWELQNKWIFITNVRGIGNNAHSIGGKLEAFTGIGRVGFTDTMTITAWQENMLCEVTHTGKLIKGKGVFEVSSNNQAAYFTWTEYIDLPFGYLGKIGWIAIRPIAKLSLQLSLNKLKKYIENNT